MSFGRALSLDESLILADVEIVSILEEVKGGSDSSSLFIPFHGSVSVPKVTAADPGGPADKTLRVQSEV